MTDAAPDGPPLPPTRRPARKIFLLVGVVLAAALGVGLFTNLGTSGKSQGAPHVGGPVPPFSALAVDGSGRVGVPADGGGNATPAVLLFFGNWCPECHQELPQLAAVVRQQEATGGALSGIRVLGIDSLDSLSDARSFLKSSGVTFPVAYDPNVTITSGAFYFEGDPYAVFVNGDGTINRIVRGATLTPAAMTADERALIPSGR
ncbi:MAG TPA: TlpA disulfide reductase family protein [Acidimicrobiales bacterium]|nr:TlpA disulfide reductase family protein [Acidimicrobiales bacterium]